MAGKDKGFSFRSLFIRDTASETQEPQVSNSGSQSSKPQAEYSFNAPAYQSTGNQDQSLVEDFVQRLQGLINQNNQPGFDFIDFTESLFEEKQNPSPEVYKTVFRIAQKIDKTLTPSKLLESAMFYKDMVQRTTETEISKGESKKQGLLSEKDNERNNLDSNLRDTRNKIQQLNQQIQELQNQEVVLNNHLLAIDQKYGNQLTDIDRKITAIRNAKEQVIVSIVDIEAGIKMNLS